MPTITLVASSLGFVFGTLFALVGNNDSVYYCVIQFFREPSSLPKQLKCRRNNGAKQQIELMSINTVGSLGGTNLGALYSLNARRDSSLFDLESLPSLCTSDTESEPDTASAFSPNVQEPRFLYFWDHTGLQDAAP
ncbi:hypothetical protein B9G98_01052 [Wickerhamiella sorbophila]|uniref:Uncharacterized protein n=1 Tax=Wickerhamiella sorbophila TaxID=45607 RepID=A0A2T0FEK5_9ASCO|nr:hypothetical protein B9G98_01052 [Wickerhamiella sorbophila]PRT53432.1 hypothetical protein B9G98_01052 [Wickerhamiella sorbophila]